MQREIKFRGKRVDNNKWVYGSYVIEDDRKHFITHLLVNGHVLNQVIPETVGQFTGERLDDDVEIYEGDLVAGYIPGSDKDRFFKLGIVSFNEGSWSIFGYLGFSKTSGDDYLGDLNHAVLNDAIKVIGNVHDNPELLTSEPH